MQALEVAQYLSDHPDFFNAYPDLAASIQIPDPHGGQAVSLLFKQISALREKTAQQEKFLAELISLGEENDTTTARIHKLAVALLAAPDRDAVLRTLHLRLAGTFYVPHIALRLWGACGVGEGVAYTPISAAALAYASSLEKPVCGLPPTEIIDWFAEHAAQIQSMALVPLYEGKELFGLLLMGSEEVGRFSATAGTQYLEWIAQLAEAAILSTR